MQVSEVKPLTNGVEILVRTEETAGLPLIEYILKYNLADRATDNQTETLVIPGKLDLFQ